MNHTEHCKTHGHSDLQLCTFEVLCVCHDILPTVSMTVLKVCCLVGESAVPFFVSFGLSGVNETFTKPCFFKDCFPSS
jgi:hypothetical protein